jgi:hypothetical protein
MECSEKFPFCIAQIDLCDEILPAKSNWGNLLIDDHPIGWQVPNNPGKPDIDRNDGKIEDSHKSIWETKNINPNRFRKPINRT